MERRNRVYQFGIGCCLILFLVFSIYRLSEANVPDNDVIDENSGIASITTWQGFQRAIANEKIKQIDVYSNLNRPAGNNAADSPGTVARDLTINGKGHEVDFGSTAGNTIGNTAIILGNITQERTLTIENVITKGRELVYSAAGGNNWTVKFRGVRVLEGEMTNYGLADAANADVVLENLSDGSLEYGVEFYCQTTSPAIRARSVTVTEGSKAVIDRIVPTSLLAGGTGNIAADEFTLEQDADAEVNVTYSQMTRGAPYGISVGKKLQLQDGSRLKMTGTGATVGTMIYFNGSGGELLVEEAELDINNGGTSIHTASGMNSDGDTEVDSCGIYGGIAKAYFYGGSKTNINTGAIAFRSTEDCRFKVTDAKWDAENQADIYPGTNSKETVINIKSERSAGIAIYKGSRLYEYGTNRTAECKSEFLFEGGATKVSIQVEAEKNGEEAAGLIAQGDGSVVEVRNEAEVIVDSTQRVAITQGSLVNAFVVNGIGAELKVHNKGKLRINGSVSNLSATAAVLRFYGTGSMNFEIYDYGEVDVIAENKMNYAQNALAPAVRLYGGGNHIKVSGGGKFNVEHTGAYTKPYSSITGSYNSMGGNQGILYTSTGVSSGENSFEVLGEESEVSITADMGAAIFTDADTRISVSDKGSFYAIGNPIAETGVFYSTRKLEVEVDKPLYFDFQNLENAGNIFTCGSGSTLELKDSNVALWERSSNLDEQADYFKYLDSMTGSGANFSNCATTPAWSAFSKNLSQYRRMSANNALAVIDKIRIPTDADKTVYVHASIPEGAKVGARDAWDDEVGVQVKVTYGDGSSSILPEVKTVGLNDTSPGLSAFGEEKAAGGWCEIPLDKYLKEGDTISVQKAWHGDAPNLAGAAADPDKNPECTEIADPEKVVKLAVPEGLTAENEVDYGPTVYQAGRFSEFNVTTPFVTVNVSKIGGTIQNEKLIRQLEEYQGKMKLVVYDKNDKAVTADIKGKLNKENGIWKWSADLTDLSLSQGDTIAVAVRHEADIVVGKEDVEPQDYKRLSHKDDYEEGGSSLADVVHQGFLRKHGGKSGYESPKAAWAGTQKQQVKFHDSYYTGRLKFYVVESGDIQVVAPKAIHYGKYEITSQERRISLFGKDDEGNQVEVEMPSGYDEPLIGVFDGRRTKSKWALTAEMEEGMKNEDTILNDIIIYHDGVKDWSLEDGAVIIAKQEGSPEEVIVTDDWYKAAMKEKGLYLSIKPNQTKAGENYKGVIEWKLIDAY